MTTATKLKRYAIVGTGGRVNMFTDPIATTYKHCADLVGFCDVNLGRIGYHQKRLKGEFEYHDIPSYHADDFDKMIEETKPDVVIITTVDAYHAHYIIRAMEHGCDAITEKPMTIDDEQCRAIYDAIKRTGRNLRVTFNYRWVPGPTLVRNLIADGTIGKVISVDMEYLLNTSHGADYFRRWHRERNKSGGLMVHKSTHHFDLVNWWVNAVPETVFGFGRLAFYGRENAEKRGIKTDYDRYTGVEEAAKDPFAINLDDNHRLKQLYLENETYDGYIRDRNVFGDNITIEDTMSVLIKYRTGVTLNYSLNAFLPREGFNVAFNGTKGRIEYRESHASPTVIGRPDSEIADMNWQNKCVVLPMFGKAYEVEIPVIEGDHGGGDPQIQAQIFDPDAPDEPYARNAGHGQGAASVLVGIAANQCFEHGKPVTIKDLCPQIGNTVRLSDLP